MNKSWFYLGAIGSLAILTTSCGDSKPAATPAASPSAVASPAASPVAAVPATTPTTPTATTPTTPTVATTGIPTVPGKKSVSVDVAAGLIPGTNGDSWAKTVSKGRPDPFATLALQPIEVIEKDPITGIGKPQKTASTIAGNNSPTIKSGVNKPLPSIKTDTRIATGGLSPSSGAKSLPGNLPISAMPRSGVNKVLPKIVVDLRPGRTTQITGMPGVRVARSTQVPSTKRPVLTKVTTIATRAEKVAEKPLQAMALEISGVIEVAGKTQVIVKLPNESFNRYIEVGDRIANGKVLVKRVEGQNSLSPTVVLEEVGVEVARKVGDKSAAAVPDTTPKPAPVAPAPIAPDTTPKLVPVNPESAPRP